MVVSLLSDATPVFLLSPWKPVFIASAFFAWAWLVSTHLEKDARAAHLNVNMWNGIHIGAAFVALFIMLFGKIFYIAFPIGLVVMIGPVLMYWKARNEAVSEQHQYHIGIDTIKSALESRKKSKTSKQVTVTFDGAHGALPIPEKDDPSLDIYLAAEKIISEAIEHRASRVEIHLTSKGCQSKYLVDGISIPQEPIAPELGAKVVAFLKDAAGTDSKDVRRRQSGEFDVSEQLMNVHVNLTASGSSSAHVVRLEFDRSDQVVRTWETTGLLPKQRELLDKLKEDKLRHGVVLIGGGTQSGLSTTAYAILSQHDAYLCNIVTVEKEVLTQLEGITHSAVEDHEGDYAAQLQTAIRRDPEIILAADLSDAAAAKVAAKPGREGPLLFITMNASSMPDLVSKWAGFVADPRKSFNALQAIVYQRLVRKLCENCRVPFKPTADLAKQGLPIESVEQLYRKGGQVEQKNKILPCPVCKGTGYLGQVGVFDTMFLDSDTRKHLIAGDLKAAMSHAKRSKLLIRLQDSAWQKVAAGETTLEEFGRVNSKKSTKKSAPASK